MNNKKVLIVSYYFPPFPKVGGRRWAKFAKYLNRDGFDTHVVCITYNGDNESPWNKDVIDYEEKVHRIRKDFERPYYMKGLPKNLIQKIKWKISLYKELYNKKKSGGIYNEQVIKNALELKRKTDELIYEHRFDVVIVTGGPFVVPYEVVKLKAKFKSVKFIVDIRDPWTGGMKNQLTPKQLDKELEKEAVTYRKADIVTTCHTFIIDDINNRLRLGNKLVHLKHAYDKEDFIIDAADIKSREYSNVIKMIYAGSLYKGMEKEIVKLTEFVNYLVNTGIKPEIDLYCFTKDYLSIINESGFNEYFNFREIVSPTELSRIMADSDVILQLRPKSAEGWENFLSSKFYELLYYRKPILYFGPLSRVGDFLEDNKLGKWIDSYQANTDFNSLFKGLTAGQFSDTNYNVSQHEYRVEVDRLKELLAQ